MHSAVIFVQGDVQNPMQFVFDGLMAANDVQNTFGATG